jgi:hypothetical protein
MEQTCVNFLRITCVIVEDEKEKISEQVIDAMIDPQCDSADFLPKSEVKPTETGDSETVVPEEQSNTSEKAADQLKPDAAETTNVAVDTDAESKVEVENVTAESSSETASEKPAGKTKSDFFPNIHSFL